MMLSWLMSFCCTKKKRNISKCFFFYSQSSWRIFFFRLIIKELESSDGYSYLFVVTCTLELKYSLANNLFFLPNISLVVGLLSVNISIALRARDISI